MPFLSTLRCIICSNSPYAWPSPLTLLQSQPFSSTPLPTPTIPCPGHTRIHPSYLVHRTQNSLNTLKKKKSELLCPLLLLVQCSSHFSSIVNLGESCLYLKWQCKCHLFCEAFFPCSRKGTICHFFFDSQSILLG